MATALSELELEGEHESELELELEHEHELELEHEHELESEHEHEHELGSSTGQQAFFNHLAAMADRGGYSQALRRVALAAGREALRGTVQRQPAIEGEHEHEHEHEHEMELELEFDPVRRQNLQAMLEHLSHAACEASSEQEAAEHFLPLIPLAAKFALPLLTKKGLFKGAAKLAPRLLKKVVPDLTRGIGKLTRTLFRRRGTRPLLRAMPQIARGTMWRLGRQAARGRAITPAVAARVLAQQTVRTLGSPRALTNSYRNSLVGDRRYHQRSAYLLGQRPGVVPIFARPVPRFSSRCPTCGNCAC